MDAFHSIGKMLIVFGIIITIIGVGVVFGNKIGLGRLPGDILFKRGNFTLYVPIVTSIVLSIVLTILFNLFRFKR